MRYAGFMFWAALTLAAHAGGRDQREIVVVSQPYHAPLEFERKGRVDGMNIDLIRWMAAESGYKVRFEMASLDRAKEMLRNKEADLISNVFISDLRDAELDFSSAVTISLINLYVQSNRSDIENLRDLAGRRVALLNSDGARKTLKDAGIDCDIQIASSAEHGVNLVTSGAADALIGNELVMQHYLYSSGRDDLRVTGNPLSAGRMCMAVREGNHELLSLLNQGISDAQRSGKLLALKGQWIGSAYSGNRLPLNAVLIGFGAALLIILLGLSWNDQLRRKVNEQTRQYAESEEQLRQLFENSPEAILVLEADGALAIVNELACTSVRMPRDQLLRKTIFDLTPPEQHKMMQQQLKQWFSDSLQQCEGALLAADGSVIPVEMNGRLQQLQGRPVFQVHLHDITLRKNAEEKMRASKQLAEDAKAMAEHARASAEKSKHLAERARASAEKSSRAKSEFLVNLSRNIRTPLNDIVGMAQMLNDKQDQTGQENGVEIIQHSSDGLLKIINNVLTIAMIESGQVEVDLLNFDIRATCKKLQARFQAQADAEGTTLQCRCAQNVPLYFSGDEALIMQVLSSLISNALKYTYQGSVSVLIESRSQSKAGIELCFQVIDTGIGISIDKQASLFDTFISTDDSESPLCDGNGLGLVICNRQVELMGGSIGFESADGQGSVFSFTLTLAQADSAESAGAEVHPDGSAELRQGMRILLVEDNAVNQQVAAAMLTQAGGVVDTVDNGRDALFKIREERYDAVLMDCEMPVMDGYEATARIRSLRNAASRVPIIAITAGAMQTDLKKCLACGMNDCITKPIHRDTLLAMLNKYTSSSIQA